MNRENILAVADAIENHSIPDLGFNLGSWFRPDAHPADDMSGHGCGTTACIAGWAVAVRDGVAINRGVGFDWFKEAGDFMGLPQADDPEAYEPTRASLMLNLDETVTARQAATVLRHLAETGEVDWDRALAEPSK